MRQWPGQFMGWSKGNGWGRGKGEWRTVRSLAGCGRTRHGLSLSHLEAEVGPLDLEGEHVLEVVVGVAGDAPEVDVEHVGGDDLVVAADAVLALDVVHELVVDARAVRHEEAGAGGELVEEEELLLGAEDAVVALLGLLDHEEVGLHLLRVREGDAVDALQGVVVGVAEPVGGGGLGHLEGLDGGRRGHVRAAAEVDQGPAAVGGGVAAVGDLGRDERGLEGVVGEHAQRLGLGEDDALEGLLGLGHGLGAGLDLRVVVLVHGAAQDEEGERDG
jgi:hypothetical protein